MTENKDWWKELKVGDTVCDCRFQHLTIVKIQRNHIKRYSLPFFFNTPEWWNDYAPEWADDLLWRAQEVTPYRLELVDMDLTLEDGAMCSAKHCCSPINHEWAHPDD